MNTERNGWIGRAFLLVGGVLWMALPLMGAGEIVVAASDSPDELKGIARYVCSGGDDRPILQKAIDEAGRLDVKCVLLSGTYVVNSRSERSPNGALCFWNEAPSKRFYLQERPRFRTLEGAVEPVGYYSGARLTMGRALYDSLSETNDFSFLYCDGGGSFGRAWILRNLVIWLPGNRKPVVAVDGSCAMALKYNDVIVTACDPQTFNAALCEGLSVPHPRSVAFRGSAGSNIGILNEWKRLSAMGFGTGFEIGGEHVYCESLEAKNNIYGFTFDCYKGKRTFDASPEAKACGGGYYPITCVNLLDEHNVHLPRFGVASHNGVVREPWAQSITIRGLNIQWPNTAPGYTNRLAPDFLKGRHRATEDHPGSWRGSVEYVIDATTPSSGVNMTHDAFFEEGHGGGIRARNLLDVPAPVPRAGRE